MNKCVNPKWLVILLIAISCNSVGFANEPQSLEYKLKALYIVRLAKFITWPENPQKNSFRICIDSSDKVAVQLRKTTETEINGRKLEIIDPPSDYTITQCDFLYLSEGKVDLSLAYFPIFTISSQADFAEQGGMIEFYIDLGKVRMKANLAAANKAGIKLSSKLIRLLKTVKQREERNE